MEITPRNLYLNRRKFLKNIAKLGLLASVPSSKLLTATSNNYSEDITPINSVLSYNNYYEFSTNKEAVKHLAKNFTTSNWTLSIEGEVENKLSLNLFDIRDLDNVDRIYPLRCVEGWSMIIPWQGVKLQKLLEIAKVKPTAKFVKFIGTFRPSEMVNQRRNILPWPYTEGLTLAEAMNPLTILATGMYKQPLSKQNGAPIRLIVPWKYGFKSIKAIQKIVVQSEKPKTSWNTKIPSEYGFYANVNPKVPHPRWSQSREVRIGELRKRPTLPFNGFKNEVESLYRDIDLETHF